MGLFNRRKDSRALPPESGHGSPAYHPHGRPNLSTDRISDYSLKSPSLTTTNSFRSNMVTSIPEIDIPQPPDQDSKPAQYLRSIYAVRERSRIVLDKAKVDKLNHFDVDLEKFQDTADYVVSIIKVSKCAGLLASMLMHNASVTSHQTSARSHHMADGSISRWVAGHE